MKRLSRIVRLAAVAGAAIEAPVAVTTTTPHVCPLDMSAAIRRS